MTRLKERMGGLESNVYEIQGTYIQIAKDLEMSLMIQRRLFEALLPSETLSVIPPPSFTSRATTS
ncbi:unnamed protein product, partial [Ilex paraguariensis]